MTILRGKLKPVAGVPTNGTVFVWSPRFRPGSDSAITEERTQAPIVDGRFEIEVDPGEATFNFVGLAGETSTLDTTIPSVDELDLLDLMEGDFEYTPPVVQAAQQAARDARADRVESQRIAEAFGGIERVDALEKSAKSSASTAGGHRQGAEKAEQNAVAAEGRAKAEADRSQGQADASAGSAGESSQSAVDADASAKDADEHRIDAQAAAVATGEDRVAVREDRLATGRARNEAQDAATRSDGRATDAETAATTAGEHEAGAKQAVDDAVAEATGITAGHAEAAEGAAGRAATSAREGKGYRDEAREAAQQAGDIATGDLPAASNAARGLIRMAGDLAGSGDDPRVPGLAMTAPGAALHLEPTSTGWSNATDDPVSSSTGWVFDGEWLRPPHWLGEVFVMVDWCGASAVSLRGRRADNTAVTLATVAAGEQDTHRQVVARVDLAEHFEVAVAGTWEQGDLDAGCRVTLFVQPVPAHSHRIDDVEGLRSALGSKVEGNDDRLTDARPPTQHQHDIDGPAGVRGLRNELDVLYAKILAKGSAHLWDGQGTWSPPDWTGPNDTVINLGTGEVHPVQEVS